MRGILLISSGLALVAMGTPAAAEPKSNRTQEIICELTGDCDGPVEVSEDQKLDKGDTAGFSFTRPGTAKVGAVTTFSTRAPAARQTVSLNVTRSAAMRPAAKRPVRAASRGAAEMRVNFALGSAQVLPSSRDEIEAFVAALQAPSTAGRRFRVEGHTDASGARDVNERLSQERAEAVAAMLKAKGIDAGRIEAKGYGPDKPLPGVSKTSPQNRRVELVPITNG